LSTALGAGIKAQTIWTLFDLDVLASTQDVLVAREGVFDVRVVWNSVTNSVCKIKTSLKILIKNQMSVVYFLKEKMGKVHKTIRIVCFWNTFSFSLSIEYILWDIHKNAINQHFKVIDLLGTTLMVATSSITSVGLPPFVNFTAHLSWTLLSPTAFFRIRRIVLICPHTPLFIGLLSVSVLHETECYYFYLFHKYLTL
jgi:hypothetical protein